jgi:hypothetical protein
MMNAHQCSSTSQCCLVPDPCGSCFHSLCNWHFRAWRRPPSAHTLQQLSGPGPGNYILYHLLLYCIVIYCSVLHNLKLWFCWFCCSNSDNMFTSSLLQVQAFLGIRRHLLSKHFHKLLLPSFGPFLWASWESTCYPPAGLLQRGEAWFAALWPYGWKVWHPQPGGVTNTTRIQENPMAQWKLLSLWECHITYITSYQSPGWSQDHLASGRLLAPSVLD